MAAARPRLEFRGVLVRTWNLFHGNTVPPRREAHLEEMVRLASEDEPDVLCLQELPPWALERLDDWSGMIAFGDVAQRPTLGPFPSTAGLGRAVTSLHHGILRSAFAGQANAILVRPGLRPLARDVIVLNARRFRHVQARWLGLPLAARLAWAGERRICQAVRLALPGGGSALVANLHATAYRPDGRLADAEVLRAAVFVDAVAAPDDICIFAGDFNVRAAVSWTMRDLVRPEWGFAGGGPRIDHVFARGAPIGRVIRWPDDRRRRDGLLLSDHAPVEAKVG
jgi:endonuclease/exonuclease/phosphatase family metal-dependent hydrolase